MVILPQWVPLNEDLLPFCELTYVPMKAVLATWIIRLENKGL